MKTRLKDIGIGTQLKIGLGIILLFVVLLSAVAWWQTDQLWLETQGLYDHPLMVRRAVGELKADALIIHGGVKDLILAKNEPERQQALLTMDASEANSERQFALLFDRYLGPAGDIEASQEAFFQWKTIRNETLRLLREGDVAQATDRTLPAGLEGAQAEKALAAIAVIDNFAKDRGDQFYRDAEGLNRSLNIQLGIIVGAIALLTLLISYFLTRGIQGPLQELTSVTEQYRKGFLPARSRYVSANEFGRLSASFNDLAATMQSDLEGKERLTRLAGVMVMEEELHSFCHELLKALLADTRSQVGAIYLRNEEKTAFELFASIGLSASGDPGGPRGSFSATMGEGEFGLALSTGKVQRIVDIPADTRFTLATVGGDPPPREILTIPILLGVAGGTQEVTAMISLANVRAFEADAVRLVDDVWITLTARMNGVLAFRRIKDFSLQLEAQNQELEAQKTELAVQKDELSEQNIELEVQKRQLDEANRLKSVFLSNMSHELRTPLNSVIALSGVLNRRLLGAIPEEEYSYLDIIERNGRRLLTMINNILDLSRIEAGQEEVNLSRFSLHALVSEVVETMEPQARQKDLQLVNQLDRNLPLITSDLDKCRHILLNLVGNAVKFTERGRVEITARPEKEMVRIEVRDTGIGIAPEQIPFIFEEFRQVDESPSRDHGGSGLGLAIARRYANLLSGSLSAESKPGEGSTFTLALPWRIEPLAGEEITDRAADKPIRHYTSAEIRGKRILLVEDSEPAIVQITDILTEEGYLVGTAHDGREALERIDQIFPDAVILDLMMPGVDGFQFLEQIRQMENTARLPVLILTAKQVTPKELRFLKGNYIHQLIEKGDIDKAALLAAVAEMVIPAAEKRVSPRSSSPSRRPPEPPEGRKPVVLVVEDNPDNMETAKALLQDHFTVLEAVDGKAGVAMVLSHKPDLVL
ncbi:MAG: ATP-binding protein, partial [Coprothermobacterota bacterium]|nr:ATP-binding protein [Coprothermobacterota bacterium]